MIEGVEYIKESLLKSFQCQHVLSDEFFHQILTQVPRVDILGSLGNEPPNDRLVVQLTYRVPVDVGLLSANEQGLGLIDVAQGQHLLLLLVDLLSGGPCTFTIYFLV